MVREFCKKSIELGLEHAFSTLSPEEVVLKHFEGCSLDDERLNVVVDYMIRSLYDKQHTKEELLVKLIGGTWNSRRMGHDGKLGDRDIEVKDILLTKDKVLTLSLLTASYDKVSMSIYDNKFKDNDDMIHLYAVSDEEGKFIMVLEVSHGNFAEIYKKAVEGKANKCYRKYVEYEHDIVRVLHIAENYEEYKISKKVLSRPIIKDYIKKNILNKEAA